GSASLVERLTGVPGAAWADVFLERRAVVTLEAAGEEPLRRTEARDAGAGVRMVRGDRSVRHAAAGGEPIEAAELAVSRLVAGETGFGGRPGREKPPAGAGLAPSLDPEAAWLTE